MLIPLVGRRIFTRITLCLLAASSSAWATPPNFAPGTAKIVVPFAAGGAADAVGRTIAEAMRKEGIPEVLVENKPGASTQIAATYVKNAKPDGLTMLLTTSATLVLMPYAFKKLPYAPEDLRPVAQIVDIPTAFVAGMTQPFNDLKGYLSWLRQNPKGASIGLATQGSSGHFGTVKLGQDIGIKFTPIVYRGASPMLVDVSSGLLPVGYDAVASMMPLYQGKKIKFLSVTGTKRHPMLPDVPTANELGLSQFEHAVPFYAIYVPAKTPDTTVITLQQVLLKALKQPAVVAKLEAAGFLVAPADAATTAKRIKAERVFWEPVIKAVGIQLE